MFESILYEGTMVVAQIHESLMHLNDNFELYFGDKDMHFIVMAVLGMILFFMVHFVFKRLAEHYGHFVHLCVHGDDRARFGH